MLRRPIAAGMHTGSRHSRAWHLARAEARGRQRRRPLQVARHARASRTAVLHAGDALVRRVGRHAAKARPPRKAACPVPLPVFLAGHELHGGQRPGRVSRRFVDQFKHELEEDGPWLAGDMLLHAARHMLPPAGGPRRDEAARDGGQRGIGAPAACPPADASSGGSLWPGCTLLLALMQRGPAVEGAGINVRHDDTSSMMRAACQCAGPLCCCFGCGPASRN